MILSLKIKKEPAGKRNKKHYVVKVGGCAVNQRNKTYDIKMTAACTRSLKGTSPFCIIYTVHTLVVISGGETCIHKILPGFVELLYDMNLDATVPAGTVRQ